MSARWETLTLGGLADIIGGGTPSRGERSYFGGTIPWVTPTDLPPIGEVRSLGPTAEAITESGLKNSSARLLPSGSVLFSSRASIGKIAVTERVCATNQGFANFVPKQGVVDGWFLAFLLSAHVDDIARLAGETTFKEVSKSKLREFAVRVPVDLAEQCRIVTRLRELMDRVDELSRLRSASTHETNALVHAARCTRLGTRDEMPHGWHEERLDSLADVIYGISAPIAKNRDPSVGPPIVRMANISLEGHLDLSDLRYQEIPKNKQQHFALRKGDLLLNWRSGSPQHVGKTAIFDAEGLFTCASFILRIRARDEKANNRLLRHTLNFMRAEGLFARESRMQINSKLNAAEFSRFPIRVPPTRKEQDDIADGLDAIERAAAKAKSEQATLALKQRRLHASILRTAFAGEL